MPGIVTSVATQQDSQSAWMHIIPVAAFAAPVHKARSFQVGYQSANLARLRSIKIVSQLLVGAKRRKTGKGLEINNLYKLTPGFWRLVRRE